MLFNDIYVFLLCYFSFIQSLLKSHNHERDSDFETAETAHKRRRNSCDFHIIREKRIKLAAFSFYLFIFTFLKFYLLIFNYPVTCESISTGYTSASLSSIIASYRRWRHQNYSEPSDIQACMSVKSARSSLPPPAYRLGTNYEYECCLAKIEGTGRKWRGRSPLVVYILLYIGDSSACVGRRKGRPRGNSFSPSETLRYCAKMAKYIVEFLLCDSIANKRRLGR